MLSTAVEIPQFFDEANQEVAKIYLDADSTHEKTRRFLW